MDALSQVPLTMTTTKATAAAGTTVTISNTGTTLFCIKGKAYSHAELANQTTLGLTDASTGLAFTPVPAGYGSVFVVGFNAAGTMQIAQGQLQALGPGTDGGAAGTTFIAAPQFPSIPDTMCPFAYFVIKVGSSGATWSLGTSNLTGPPANTGVTFVDVMTMPDRPQVA